LILLKARLSDLDHYDDTDTADYINASSTIPDNLCTDDYLLISDGTGWGCIATSSLGISGTSGWTSLSDMTLAMRRKHGKGAKILQDTGRGKGSIDYKVISNQQVEIGTDVGYMGIHQTGGTVRMFGKTKVKIPKRKFLLFQSEDDKNIVKIFTEYLGEIIR